jgi:hypothetical protein
MFGVGRGNTCRPSGIKINQEPAETNYVTVTRRVPSEVDEAIRRSRDQIRVDSV